jgi:hypothetical protein
VGSVGGGRTRSRLGRRALRPEEEEASYAWCMCTGLLSDSHRLKSTHMQASVSGHRGLCSGDERWEMRLGGGTRWVIGEKHTKPSGETRKLCAAVRWHLPLPLASLAFAARAPPSVCGTPFLQRAGPHSRPLSPSPARRSSCSSNRVCPRCQSGWQRSL